MMRIKKNIYEDILEKTPSEMPESGGILGGEENTITTFVFDQGKTTSHCRCNYTPDVALLNKCIEEWGGQGVDFYGMFHSHFYGVHSLSEGDITYIKKIMSVMPAWIKELHFPIVVFPDKKMVSYLCYRDNKDGIAITEEAISLM